MNEIGSVVYEVEITDSNSSLTPALSKDFEVSKDFDSSLCNQFLKFEDWKLFEPEEGYCCCGS